MHVVCALYVPGVAFGDIDKLRPVTLTEMNYSKYGAKASTLYRIDVEQVVGSLFAHLGFSNMFNPFRPKAPAKNAS